MIDNNAIIDAMLKVYTDQDDFLGMLEELIDQGDERTLLKLIAKRRSDVALHLTLWRAMEKIGM